jgi:cyclic-di-AMP phosphodiesterase PgpH
MLRLPRWWPWKTAALYPTGSGSNRESRIGAILSLLLLISGIWATLTFSLPGADGLETGQPSPMSIAAPATAVYTSELLTAERRSQAAASSDNLVYLNDGQLPVTQRRELFNLLDSIGRIRSDTTLSAAQRLAALTGLANSALQLSRTQAEILLELDGTTWSRFRSVTLEIYDRAIERYDYTLDERAIAEIRDRWLAYWLSTTGLSADQQAAVITLTDAHLKVNRTLDTAATAARREAAAAQVQPVQITVLAGESIVREGEIVTPAVAEKLQATGAMPKPLSWTGLFGQGLLALLLGSGLIGYIRNFQRSLIRRPRSLLILIATLLFALAAARLLLPLMQPYPTLFPLAALAIVVAVVFNGHLAIAVTLTAAITIAVIAGSELRIGVVLTAGALAAILTIRSAERLTTFVISGLATAGAVIVAESVFWLADLSSLRGADPVAFILPTLMIGSVSGGLSTVLALGAFNLVSRIAGQVTPLQLMELAHPTQPLLRRLIREAPGSYYHSVAVGNLAEAAAEAVGADALLLRVAAYYHDIGKTLRPSFFIDNQMGRENVHDELDPQTSAQIIIDHVREGIKTARAAGLPEQLIDFIASHHGTSLVRHFYQRALQTQDSVNEADFRYPGPKPQTREQAILMLADTVEATVRAKAQNGKISAQPGPDGSIPNEREVLDLLVGSIIDGRLRDGELSDAPLTIRDLGAIRQAFVSSLKSIYHPRVEYAAPLKP